MRAADFRVGGISRGAAAVNSQGRKPAYALANDYRPRRISADNATCPSSARGREEAMKVPRILAHWQSSLDD
jgi:hypothetical protein